jgi:CxxC motif-containing protein (DUF1111 family)
MRHLLIVLALGLVPAAAAATDDGLDAVLGRALFKRSWLPAPASTDSADGLGPLFNSRSCAACHPGGGGARVRAEADGSGTIVGFVVRIAGRDGAPHPYYGVQIQSDAVPGLRPEGRVRLGVPPPAAARDDRSRLEVRLDGPPAGQTFHLGARLAPSLRGRAVLDAISADAVLALAAPERQAALGLAGQARLVPDAEGRLQLGRYGWKASQPDLVDQIAQALVIDLGLSTPRRPLPYGDCTELQTACRARPHGDSALNDGREVSAQALSLMTTYLRELPAPSAGSDPQALATFNRLGCAGCHVPDLPARGGGEVRAFTDLLLHDMGRDLDDGVAEPGVESARWRTAPLIDISDGGGARRYLHDGRAGDIAAAVAWHGGEAAAARAGFARLDAAERARLIAFLKTL